MKDNVIEIILEDNINGTRHNGKMIFYDNNEMLLKVYEKSSGIRRLKYVGENLNYDSDNIRYKQIIEK